MTMTTIASKVRRFFREGNMQATTERTEAEWGTRLAEINAAISAGEGDVIALLEERETVELQLNAARIRKEKADNAAYRARLAEAQAQEAAEVEKLVREIGEYLPRAMWALQGLADKEKDGTPRAERYGIPFLFARDALEAIRTRGSSIEWDYNFLSGLPNELPRPKPERQMFLLPDNRRPPGYTGVVWPPEALD